MIADALPPDLVAFLSGDRELSYDAAACEIGKFSFHRLEDVREIELAICPSADDWIAEDPYQGRGYYAIDAIDLLATCEGYDPVGMLVFIPIIGEYGSFDCDHQSMIIFPDLTWPQFAADPVRYINAVWGPDEQVARILNPVGRFPHYDYD